MPYDPNNYVMDIRFVNPLPDVATLSRGLAGPTKRV